MSAHHCDTLCAAPDCRHPATTTRIIPTGLGDERIEVPLCEVCATEVDEDASDTGDPGDTTPAVRKRPTPRHQSGAFGSRIK